ncbi:dTDP-glucose 4,6-dehydratase [Caballeronia mineralivorans PML1(12)]|uniref:dTDP-glucose 4,6-dehydratase n=1 Tax=Caballeronia mineralivorans PML1(12) TaxID=908627 RepID=A0A0J1CX29_9BURK|nr:dTDP-glucose 4,6-dehydratase [Caballeronia mineralivorans]KLU24936.1 dTDP-glucose 4,6-dehydratase [Caballeronia mineralivorans PML1(12)]
MSYRPKQVLVTGGAGFIGANYVRHLLATDPQVRIVNLDLLTYAGSLDNLAVLPDDARHTFVRGDIADQPLVESVLREHAIDTIVHFAAESHVDRSITGPGEFVRTNVVGTWTLLEAARQYWLNEQRLSAVDAQAQRRFHHISTDEVFGTLGPDDAAFSERTPYAPNSPYSSSKAGSDHLVRAYFHTYGLPVSTTHCSNNYGPYQHGEKFIPTVVRSCLEGTDIPVYGNGSNIRDWLYVEDHCRAIEAVIGRGTVGETYNIGGCNEWTNIDIVALICALMDRHRPHDAPHARLVTFVADRPGHDWRYAINAAKMMRELQWRPVESFETGIAKTLEWLVRRQS